MLMPLMPLRRFRQIPPSSLSHVNTLFPLCLLAIVWGYGVGLWCRAIVWGYCVGLWCGAMVWGYCLGLWFGAMVWGYCLGLLFEAMVWGYCLFVCVIVADMSSMVWQ